MTDEEILQAMEEAVEENEETAPVQTDGETQSTEEEFIIADHVLLEYTGNAQKVIIPDGVTQIGYFAFCGCTSMTSIQIPESVTQINANVFMGCSSLKFVKLPDKFSYIGEDVFSGCKSLISVQFPDNYSSYIPSGTFSFCKSLDEFHIPATATEIHPHAFAFCTHLHTINIPDNVAKIYDCAFAGCTGLEMITLPSTVKIRETAFNRCTSLSCVRIRFPSGEIGTFEKTALKTMFQRP